MQRIVSMAAGLLLALALAGCTTTANEQPAEPVYTTISEGTLAPGAAVPPPEGAVILTVQGAIANTNATEQLDLDMATLEQIGVIEYTVPEDPYADRAVTYQGVLLEDVLAVAAVADEAETLHAIALDDYTVDVPLDVTRWPVMLATRQDGERIPISEKGPVRVVFPYGQFDIDQDFYNPMWIWNLRTIEVR